MNNIILFNKKSILLLATLLIVGCLAAQKRIATPEYIELYKNIAVKKQKEYKIPASITLAQGILESGSGNSSLARKANNHFGIKCHKGWKGKTYIMDDDAKNECFRKYRKAEDSYRDHSLFLTQRGRYSSLFDLKITDYKGWAYGLKAAGYATNPKYPQLLIKIIEKYNLNKFDAKSNKKVKTSKKEKSKNKETYKTISVANFKQVDSWQSGRKIYKNNGRKLIIIKKGDTFYGLANEFELYSWQFYSYNELEKKHVLKVDEIIYLEKKKRKAEKKYKFHVVAAGETMQRISQLYGVRLKRLYKMNNLSEGVQVAVGTKVRLR